MEHKFNYNWTLKDANFTKDKGTVFSCFACGGGSTMGYKLAGFDVIGCNEIDPKMMEAYRTNHNPKYSFLEPIQTFKLRKDLPEELYQLDILDGSPPCSSFSMAGNREKDWGKDKKFREGQQKQVLDTLFFDFIDLAAELKPKIVIAENVKGLLLGSAKTYVREIYRQFDNAGYFVQHWLLDASKMGVPQRRERVFFIALRKDLAIPFLYQKDLFTVVPKLELKFNESKILFKEVKDVNAKQNTLSEYFLDLFNYVKISDPDMRYATKRKTGKQNNFGHRLIKDNMISWTLLAGDQCVVYSEKRYFTNNERLKIGSYPKDYNFIRNKPEYLIGMSVPPVMVAQIATKIYEQWRDVFN